MAHLLDFKLFYQILGIHYVTKNEINKILLTLGFESGCFGRCSSYIASALVWPWPHRLQKENWVTLRLEVTWVPSTCTTQLPSGPAASVTCPMPQGIDLGEKCSPFDFVPKEWEELMLRAVKDREARMSHLRTEIGTQWLWWLPMPVRDVSHLEMASSQTALYSQPSFQPSCEQMGYQDRRVKSVGNYLYTRHLRNKRWQGDLMRVHTAWSCVWLSGGDTGDTGSQLDSHEYDVYAKEHMV